MTNRRYIAYYRVSTAKQGASGLGLDAQREAVHRFLHDGAELVASYTDIESGTRKGNGRPELARAMAHAKRSKATLVIAKLDRLARNVAFVSGLMESSVDFVAADNPTATRLTIHILAAVAEAEAEAISRRTKEALAAAKARGVQLGRPENLKRTGQKAGALATQQAAISEYAYLVDDLYGMRSSGMSLRQIASELNGRGHKTRNDGIFKPTTVKRILDRLLPSQLGGKPRPYG